MYMDVPMKKSFIRKIYSEIHRKVRSIWLIGVKNYVSSQKLTQVSCKEHYGIQELRFERDSLNRLCRGDLMDQNEDRC